LRAPPLRHTTASQPQSAMRHNRERRHRYPHTDTHTLAAHHVRRKTTPAEGVTGCCARPRARRRPNQPRRWCEEHTRAPATTRALVRLGAGGAPRQRSSNSTTTGQRQKLDHCDPIGDGGARRALAGEGRARAPPYHILLRDHESTTRRNDNTSNSPWACARDALRPAQGATALCVWAGGAAPAAAGVANHDRPRLRGAHTANGARV
jgi:hypothetical protein